MIYFRFIQNSGQSQILFQTPFAFQNDFQSNGSVLSKECPQKLDENLISLSISKIIGGLFLSQSTLKGRNHLIGNHFERQMVFETGFGIGRNFV
jgi:hypothetical protein